MAKIIIAGDAMVIESSHTLETIATLEAHRPKALTLFDEDGKTEIFKVGTTKGKGNINAYGASFGSASKNEGKKAIITLDIPSDVEDAKAYAEKTIGTAIIHLNRVEEKFADALASVNAELEAVRSKITVM